MDLGKTNEALNANGRDFDLNIPYAEDLDLNATNQFSSPTVINTQLPAFQSSTENMKNEATNKGENEVQQSPIVDKTVNEASSGVKVASSEDKWHVEPKYVSSVSFASASIAHRRRRRRRATEVKQSDPDRYCTNFYCRTKKTPMWRKGPLGPRTLCNACGLQYMKMVSGSGSGSRLSAGEGDAASVPAEKVEASSDF